MHEKIKDHYAKKLSSPLKCDQCPYETYWTSSLSRHKRGVHVKVSNHVCEDCGYAAYQKSSLIQHRESVHNVGDKVFKCELCPYTSVRKATLKMHIERVHEKKKKAKDEILKCEQCPFISVYKQTDSKNRSKWYIPVKKPIDCKNQSDIFCWQTNGIQNHDHGDQPSLWNTSSANGSGSSRNGYSHNLSDTHLHLTNLGDENGGHGLVQGCTVHIDGSANRQHESKKNSVGKH